MYQLDTPPCHGSSCRTVSFMATFRKVGPVAWSSKLSGPSSTWTFLGGHGPMPKSICLVIFDLKLDGWFNSTKIHENPLYQKRKAPIVAEFGHLLRKILRLKLHRAVDTPTSVAFIERCGAIVIYHGHQWDLWLISPMINCHYRNWPHPEIWNILKYIKLRSSRQRGCSACQRTASDCDRSFYQRCNRTECQWWSQDIWNQSAGPCPCMEMNGVGPGGTRWDAQGSQLLHHATIRRYPTPLHMADLGPTS